MTLVPDSEYPFVSPTADWVDGALARRHRLLAAMDAAYRTHDPAIHVEDEMWNGLLNGGSHKGEGARWARAHYMYGGRSALRSCVNALLLADAPAPRRVLDFPSGHGRVTRFFRAAFPSADIFAGDINRGGIAFCAERFGAIPVLSQPDLDAVELPSDLDLVWCGSLATHLPEAACRALFRRLVDCLAPGGLAGITVCSRGMEWAHKNSFKTISDERYAAIEGRRRETGFGYADYPGNVGYGMTFVDMRWIREVIEARDDAHLLCYQEKGWHGTQDPVWIIKRPLSHCYDWGQD